MKSQGFIPISTIYFYGHILQWLSGCVGSHPPILSRDKIRPYLQYYYYKYSNLTSWAATVPTAGLDYSWMLLVELSIHKHVLMISTMCLV